MLDAAPAVTPLTDKPPAELAAGVSARLSAAARIVAGDATLEIWLVQKLDGSGGPGWSGVESGTLAGAMRVTGSFKEIRGKAVKPGVYTLRY